MESNIIVSLLCHSVYSGDTVLLQRMIRAGAQANKGDWDKRTALHIAAAEGNLAAVKVGGSKAPCLYIRAIFSHTYQEIHTCIYCQAVYLVLALSLFHSMYLDPDFSAQALSETDDELSFSAAPSLPQP